MKTILCCALVLLFTTTSAQNIIKYKNQCEKAYSHFLLKEYANYINAIDEIGKKYPLKGEELYHKAISLSQCNRKDEAVEVLRQAWRTTYIDLSFRCYKYSETSNLLGFSDAQNLRLNEGNDTEDWNRGFTAGDSLIKLMNTLMDIDQNDRELLFSGTDSLTFIRNHKTLAFHDSIAQVRLNEIIEKYNFPGDSICHNHQAASELMLWHATNKTFFEQNNKRLFAQINQGFISPYAYAYWYDRCMIDQDKAPKYFQFSFVPKLSESKIYKNRRKIGMSKYYELLAY
jgi:hypothetical protein